MTKSNFWKKHPKKFKDFFSGELESLHRRHETHIDGRGYLYYRAKKKLLKTSLVKPQAMRDQVVKVTRRDSRVRRARGSIKRLGFWETLKRWFLVTTIFVLAGISIFTFRTPANSGSVKGSNDNVQKIDEAMAEFDRRFEEKYGVKEVGAKVVEETKENTVLNDIWEASNEYGVDYELMKKIAFCESSYNPKAQSTISTAGGTFQFINATWKSTLKAMGEDVNQSKYDGKLNARAAAFKIAHGGLNAWNASRYCWK